MSNDVKRDGVRVARRRRATIRVAVLGLVSAAVGVLSIPAAHAVVAPPSVTINQAVGQADPTSGSTVQFTVVFSQTVTGFVAADVSLAGSAGTPVAALSGSGANYTVSVTGMTSSGTVIATILAGVAQNTTGELNEASTTIDNTVTWIDVVPTVTIDQSLGQADPTSGSTVQFTVVFSQSVTGFTAAEVGLAGSAGTLLASLSGSGANYTVSVTGMVTDGGTVIATIPAGAAQDSDGDGNIASASVDNTVTWVDLAPTVTINQSLGQADPTSGSTAQFTVVFNETVTGITAADVNLTASTAGGTLVAAVSGSGANYTVAVTGMTADGTVVAFIPAGAAIDNTGNASIASTSFDNTVTWLDLAPTVTINQSPGQADPTSTSPVEFTVVFNETVTGFTGADVNLAASTAGGTLVAAVSGSGANYTVSVTGMTTGGTIVAIIPANAAQDGTGNFNTASTSVDNTVTWNPPTGPTPSPSGTSAGGGLAATGTDVGWLITLSLALVTAGIATVVAVRRRRSATES